MSNMSYCRFGNTLHDFRECYGVLDEARSFTEMNLSEEETLAMNRLAAYARLYLERFDELQQEEEYEFARNLPEVE